MDYTDCNVLYELKKKKEPLISKVPIDNFTKMVSSCFDFEFNGESKFFPYELPKEILDMDFNIIEIQRNIDNSMLEQTFNSYLDHFNYFNKNPSFLTEKRGKIT